MTQKSARAALREAFGEGADFRPGQWEAIEAVLRPGARLLVVQRTGWGKSIVYFLAARGLGQARRGMALVVSPLLSLMRNQIELAARMGVRAATLNSTNEDEWETIERRLRQHELEALFVSPERLAHPRFAEILEESLSNVGLLVIDEAHCISDWGHDFRPDYRRILRLTERLPVSSSILATTATATPRVIEDVARQLGGQVQVQRGSVVRESLRLAALELPDHAERLAWIGRTLPKLPGTGILYALTVSDAETVADYLKSLGWPVEPYHAAMDSDLRIELERKFQANELKALAATTALGMGYDKGDVGFVIHYQLPTSMLAYYQQIGRAGRTLATAHVCLLFGEIDQEIARHFEQSAVPPKAVFDRILSRLEQGEATLAELGVEAGCALPTLLQALTLLHVDETIMRKVDRYALRPGAAPPDLAKYRALQALRRAESEEMLAFARGESCRMQAIAAALGEEGVVPCGRCDRCRELAPSPPPAGEVQLAAAFLASRTFAIEPKVFLPTMRDGKSRTQIPAGRRLRPGIALSSYNASGWGRMIRDAKYGPNAFPEELVEAAAGAIRAAEWELDWVAWVPSFTDRKVEEFARRLAARLGLEAVEAVRKVRRNEPQKTMLFPLAQFENVHEAFSIEGARPGTCLLVDDIVDSGWTLAVIGMSLLAEGAGAVRPFALATARPRRSK